MVMTLKEFIGETLSQIVLGIDDAKKKLEPSGRSHWAGPPISTVGKGGPIHDTDVAVWLPGGEATNKANLVRFDVAVHAAEAKEGGGGVKVAVAHLGGKLSAEQSSVSRIQFDIPLIIAEHPRPVGAKKAPPRQPIVGGSRGRG